MSHDGGRVAIRCGYCRRLIREVDLDPGGTDVTNLALIGPRTRDGSPPPAFYAREREVALAGPFVKTSGQRVRRIGQGADFFDASPGEGRLPGFYPTRYRFVCRGPRHRDGRVLDRIVRDERLLAMCRDALGTPGPAEIVLR